MHKFGEGALSEWGMDSQREEMQRSCKEREGTKEIGGVETEEATEADSAVPWASSSVKRGSAVCGLRETIFGSVHGFPPCEGDKKIHYRKEGDLRGEGITGGDSEV